MTDKELRRLSRADLLELLLEQSREVERLKAELAEATGQLESRRLEVTRAGSIAEAALQLNGVFTAAQQAADQYVENVKRQFETVMRQFEAAQQKTEEMESRCRELETETRAKCLRMVQQAREQADACLRDARRQAERTRGPAAPRQEPGAEPPEQLGEEEP